MSNFNLRSSSDSFFLFFVRNSLLKVSRCRESEMKVLLLATEEADETETLSSFNCWQSLLKVTQAE